MKKMIVVSMMCALAGVGVAVAQERGNARGDRPEHGECNHDGHGRGHGKLKKLDTNNDGRITRAEFNAHSEERFKKMDLNNDGVVTTEELQQLHGRHARGERGERGQRGPRQGSQNVAGSGG